MKDQSFVGVTLQGNLKVISLQWQSEYCSTYISQDLSTSTFYELKAFLGNRAPRRKLQFMWKEYECLKEDNRFVKEWKQDGGTFVLLILPDDFFFTEEGVRILDTSDEISDTAGYRVLKNSQIPSHTKPSKLESGDKARVLSSLSYGDTGGNALHITVGKDTVERHNDPSREAREAIVGHAGHIKGERGKQDQKKKKGKIMRTQQTQGRDRTLESGAQKQKKRRKRTKKPKQKTSKEEEEQKRAMKIKGGQQTADKCTELERGMKRMTMGEINCDENYSINSVTHPTKEMTNKPRFPKNKIMRLHQHGNQLSVSFEKAANGPEMEPLITQKQNTITMPVQKLESELVKDISHLYFEFPIYFPHEKQATSQKTEIRLLVLKPTFMGQSLICNMYCTSLQNSPNFIALSYAWGDADKTHTIHVRGYTIPVTKNLHQALTQLRDPLENLVIWVDAICINQTNLQERNYQVKQMPKIYSAAQEVVAWLGEQTIGSDAAMELITLTPEALMKKLQRKERLSVQNNLRDLFSRPYWSRVWVVQELASANRTRRACTLRCGAKSVALNQLRAFMGIILRQLKFSELKAMTRPRCLISLSTQDPSRSFLDVLWESSSLLATDARDRIYGIRGISPKFYRDNIEVNYTSNYEQLCRKVMALMFNKERSLDVLCCFQGYTSEPTSPSWLRDFSKRNPGISPNMYSCAKNRKANAEIVNRILRTRGVLIGRVGKITVFNKTSRQDHWLWKRNTNLKLDSELRAIKIQAFEALKERYPQDTDRSRDNRFWDMFAGGKQPTLEHLGEENRMNELQKLWVTRVSYEEGTISSDVWHRYDESFCSTFVRLLGRAMFTTVEGNPGLGPRSMQEDDVVCVIYGCRLPVILRKDGRYYTFIGPAYVDGAMNGEFVRESKKVERFWIR
jgi:hypothetical protein